MKKVGIVANLNKSGSPALLKKISAWFTQRKIQVMDSTAHSEAEIIRQSEMIICLGGDGTILSVARKMKTKSIPILGVNLGHLGFLTEVKDKEVFAALGDILKKKYTIDERLMLTCSVKSPRGGAKEFVALNDIVVSREGLTKFLHVDVFISGEKLTSFRGDGLILATPTGSTAYSLSAGGAIVYPSLEALIVTPICPHASSLRPLVVRGDEEITVKIETTRKGEKALLTADGQESYEIDDSYKVQVTRAKATVKLVKVSNRSYIATLRENFRFPN